MSKEREPMIVPTNSVTYWHAQSRYTKQTNEKKTGRCSTGFNANFLREVQIADFWDFPREFPEWPMEIESNLKKKSTR